MQVFASLSGSPFTPFLVLAVFAALPQHAFLEHFFMQRQELALATKRARDLL